MRGSMIGMLVACSEGVPQTNLPPVVELSDVETLVGEEITLQPTVFDPEGEELSYQWTVRLQPPLSWADIRESANGVVTLEPDRVGPYLLDLRVSDGVHSVTASSVILAGSSDGPSVQIDGQSAVLVTRETWLDASGSSDPAGLRLFFDWALLDVPEGSALTVEGSADPLLLFTPDELGTYRFAVTVHNGSSATVEQFAVEALLPAIDAGDVASGTFLPEQAYAYGNASSNLCEQALGHWSDLDTLVGGISQCVVGIRGYPQIGRDGRFHYLDQHGILRAMTCDGCPSWPGDGTALSSEWLTNDQIVGDLPCDGVRRGMATQFALSPSGRLTMRCDDAWVDDQDRSMPPSHVRRIWYSDHDRALGSDGTLLDFATGTVVPVAGWPASFSEVWTGRTVKGGFWAMFDSELWFVDVHQATAEKTGDYAPHAPDLVSVGVTALDADGSVVQALSGDRGRLQEVWRRRLDGVAYRVHDPDAAHGLWRVHHLVTGP
ncbi:MAG: hypothetical protein KTR31_17200 [Myxococcales bacterium]|nr:hypothetical protein [Myxococcales bacterium]